jgi:glycosyltransferase involved in cell wall biosynthesis
LRAGVDKCPSARLRLQSSYDAWMRPARILNIVDMVPNKRGPVELQLLEIARQASERGMQYGAYFSGPIPAWYSADMVQAGARLGVFDRSAWTAEVLALCERERPDLAHFHFGPHAAMTEVSDLGVKVVRTEHSIREPRRGELARVAVRHWRTRKVDRIIAVSEFVARQTRRDFAVRRSRVSVVLNAADLGHFRPRPAERRDLRRELLGLSDEHVAITIAASLRPAKRQAMAIRAMPEILAHAPSARLILAGDGPDRELLRSLVDEQHLEGSIQLLTADNDVAAIYAASDIALLPSTGEGIGAAGIEALACGIPLVATPHGGTGEVYEEGSSGVSVSEESSHGIAMAIVPLAQDRARREKMGAAGRERAERLFSMQRPARETLAVYDELLGRDRARRRG